MNQKEFVKLGNYLLDEIKTRNEKHDGHFFDADSMKFFTSKVYELCWQKDDNIYFVTSEKDRFYIKHKGSIRAFTVRVSNKVGHIDTIGEFQEHKTLSQAINKIKKLMEKTN